jgi:chaperone BCS1
MTTNYPDKLDAALVRPGRVDRREEIGPLAASEARKLFLRFYPGCRALAERINDATYRPMPAAVLQGQFMSHSENPEMALLVSLNREAAAAE